MSVSFPRFGSASPAQPSPRKKQLGLIGLAALACGGLYSCEASPTRALTHPTQFVKGVEAHRVQLYRAQQVHTLLDKGAIARVETGIDDQKAPQWTLHLTNGNRQTIRLEDMLKPQDGESQKAFSTLLDRMTEAGVSPQAPAPSVLKGLSENALTILGAAVLLQLMVMLRAAKRATGEMKTKLEAQAAEQLPGLLKIAASAAGAAAAKSAMTEGLPGLAKTTADAAMSKAGDTATSVVDTAKAAGQKGADLLSGLLRGAARRLPFNPLGIQPPPPESPPDTPK